MHFSITPLHPCKKWKRSNIFQVPKSDTAPKIFISIRASLTWYLAWSLQRCLYYVHINIFHISHLMRNPSYHCLPKQLLYVLTGRDGCHIAKLEAWIFLVFAEKTYIKSPSVHPFGILLCKRPGTSVRYYYDYKSSSCCNQRKGSIMEQYPTVAWQLNPSGVSYHAEELLRVLQSSPAEAAPRPQAGKHPPVA